MAVGDFYQGRNVRLFHTTETTGSFVQSNSTPEIVVKSGSVATDFIPPLGSSITYAGTTGKMLVETIELELEPDREEIDFLGRNRKEMPHMRDMWKMTINRRSLHPLYAMLYDKADNGIAESSSTLATDSFRPAAQQRDATDGYRFYLWLETNSCITLQGGTLEDYQAKPAVGGIMPETIIVSGNIYKVSSSAYTTSIAATEL